MDELAREYYKTHDPEIREEIYELARRLREMEHWGRFSPEFLDNASK